MDGNNIQVRSDELASRLCAHTCLHGSQKVLIQAVLQALRAKKPHSTAFDQGTQARFELVQPGFNGTHNDYYTG
jgi:hypothetical protein